jgi:hypothetical protein
MQCTSNTFSGILTVYSRLCFPLSVMPFNSFLITSKNFVSPYHIVSLNTIVSSLG